MARTRKDDGTNSHARHPLLLFPFLFTPLFPPLFPPLVCLLFSILCSLLPPPPPCAFPHFPIPCTIGTRPPLIYSSQSCLCNPGDDPLSRIIITIQRYGLPSDAGVATAVNGQPIFPVYNNNGKYTPQKCEVDSCNEHVGQVRTIGMDLPCSEHACR
jgi:hypothetical protein